MHKQPKFVAKGIRGKMLSLNAVVLIDNITHTLIADGYRGNHSKSFLD